MNLPALVPSQPEEKPRPQTPPQSYQVSGVRLFLGVADAILTVNGVPKAIAELKCNEQNSMVQLSVLSAMTRIRLGLVHYAYPGGNKATSSADESADEAVENCHQRPLLKNDGIILFTRHFAPKNGGATICSGN